MRISDWSSDVCSSDLVRERQRLELARHFDAAGIRDTGPKRPIILGLLSAIRQFPTAVLAEQRKDTLGEVIVAVRQFGFGPCYNGVVAIAPILSDADFHEQEIRTEERSEGKECVSTRRSGLGPTDGKKKK